MKKRYIKFPFEKKYNANVADIKTIENELYASVTESNVFLGNDKVQADEFLINGKDSKIKVIDSTYYFKIDDETSNVEFLLNYDKRLQIMEENLANAIVRLIIHKNSKFVIKDFKVGTEINKIYLEAKDLSYDFLNKLEDLSNYLVLSNLEIKYNDFNDSIFIGKDEIKYYGPCLKRCGEVGIIKIHSILKENGLVVLNILAGQRSLKDYKEKSKLLRNIREILFLKSNDDLIKEIKKLKTNTFVKESKDQENNNSLEIKDVTNEKEDITHSKRLLKFKNYIKVINNTRFIYKILYDEKIETVINIANELSKYGDLIQIYGLPIGDSAKIIVTRSKDINIDLKEIFEKIKGNIDLVGGGNMYSIEVNIPIELLNPIMESFLMSIKKRLT